MQRRRSHRTAPLRGAGTALCSRPSPRLPCVSVPDQRSVQGGASAPASGVRCVAASKVDTRPAAPAARRCVQPVPCSRAPGGGAAEPPPTPGQIFAVPRRVARGVADSGLTPHSPPAWALPAVACPDPLRYAARSGACSSLACRRSSRRHPLRFFAHSFARRCPLRAQRRPQSARAARCGGARQPPAEPLPTPAP